MMTFSEIANHFLRCQGLEPQECASEEEAKCLAARRNGSSKRYPVYYFESDTSGEKPFEEFVANGECADLESFQSLGIIRNAPRKPMNEIQQLTTSLSELLTNRNLEKSDIVEALQTFLPSFQHIETGKNLDQKM